MTNGPSWAPDLDLVHHPDSLAGLPLDLPLEPLTELPDLPTPEHLPSPEPLSSLGPPPLEPDSHSLAWLVETEPREGTATAAVLMQRT